MGWPPRFRRDPTRAYRYARASKVGTVGVNAYFEGKISTPFGGIKASGSGGGDNGILADEHYNGLKTIWIDLSS